MTQYRITTDENGYFSLDLPALEKGTYTMKAIFEGDSDAYGSEITKTLMIQGRAYAISIEANNEIIQSGDTTTLTLSFEDEDGDPVIEPGQTIKLYQEYVVSDIILTSDKDILSYADNDVATLTAKVKTSSGGIPVGVDVVFKKDGVLLDTVQTNTQGIATYSYASTGAGDITFSAECDFVSETYSIIDAKYICKENDLSLSSNTQQVHTNEQYDLTLINPSNYGFVYFSTNNSSSNWIYIEEGNGFEFEVLTYTGSVTLRFDGSTSNDAIVTIGRTGKYKIMYEGATTKVYIDNQLITTVNTSNESKQPRWRINSNSTISLNNIMYY